MTVRSPDTTPPSTTRCPAEDPAPVDSVPPDTRSPPLPTPETLDVSDNAPACTCTVEPACRSTTPDIVPPPLVEIVPPVTCNVAPALWLNGTAITPVLPAVADIDDVAVFVNVGVPPIPVISGS